MFFLLFGVDWVGFFVFLFFLLFWGFFGGAGGGGVVRHFYWR